jgi:hypothetical protein
MKILTQMSPQESPTVVDLIQKFPSGQQFLQHTFRSPGQQTILVRDRNGIAKRFDKRSPALCHSVSPTC